MIGALLTGVILLLMYLNHVDGLVRRLDDRPKRKGSVQDDER